MGAALGTIDLIQVLEGELQLGSQTFNLAPKAALREWCQLVEEWLNDGRVDKDHQDLEGEPGSRYFSFKTKFA